VIYLLFVLLALMSATAKMLQKQFTNLSRNVEQAKNVYMLVVSLIAMVFFASMAGWDLRINGLTFVYAVLLAVLSILANLMLLKAMDYADIVTISVYASAGAIVIPFLFGVLFFKEEVSICKIISFFLLLLIVILPLLKREGKERMNFFGYFYSMMLFLEAGGSVMLIKFYSRAESVMNNNVLCFWANVLMLPFVLVMALKTERHSLLYSIKQLSRSTYAVAALSVVVSNASTLLSMYVVGKINLTVYTLLQNPLSLILTALCSWLFFKEKINRQVAFNIVVSMIALLLNNI